MRLKLRVSPDASWHQPFPQSLGNCDVADHCDRDWRRSQQERAVFPKWFEWQHQIGFDQRPADQEDQPREEHQPPRPPEV